MKATRPALDAPLIDWALYWYDHGWRVFPLKTSGKDPLFPTAHGNGDPLRGKCKGECGRIGHGFLDGLNASRETIAEWWQAHPSANIGATPPAGWVVVDIDGPLDAGVTFPDTRTHDTGKGRHLIYINNVERPVGQTSGNARLWTNVDTRVSGKGYIVLPPSIHPDTGKPYTITDTRDPIELPTAMIPAKPKRETKRRASSNDEIIKLLTMPRDSAELGDDAMAKIAGWFARYLPTKEHFSATLDAINAGLSNPLPDSSMAKKRGVWDKHHELVSTRVSEAPGWLLESPGDTYLTEIGIGDSVELVPVSNFRIVVKGVINHPTEKVWIVDVHKNDGEVIADQHVSSNVTASSAALKKWLHSMGCAFLPHTADKRGDLGSRLLMSMIAQDYPELNATDHFGWHNESKAFVVSDGEITSAGHRSFTNVYADRNLSIGCPVSYRFDADLSLVRDWFKRILALQDEAESAKIGAWLMMLMLRGQWKGLLPGILVEAFAGIGKTTFFKLFSALAGVPQEGENLTVAVARDILSGHSSGFIWLDDVKTDAKLEQLVRKTITEGKEVLKVNHGDGWQTTFRNLRGSVIISGEGVDFYRQKAYRDRFINVTFKSNPSTDANKLSREDVGAGAGTLLQCVLSHADMLSEYPVLLESATNREEAVRAALRMGARILDAVLDTGSKYTRLIDAWASGDDMQMKLGQASECVLNVFPTLWRSLGFPESPGDNGLVMPIYWDNTDQAFWIHAGKVADHWQNQRNVDARQRQLTTQLGIRRELDACGASKTKSKRTGLTGTGAVVDYRMLPQQYSDFVRELATERNANA